MSSFLYETKDRMEQYKIQLSLTDKKAEFLLVRMGWRKVCPHV